MSFPTLFFAIIALCAAADNPRAELATLITQPTACGRTAAVEFVSCRDRNGPVKDKLLVVAVNQTVACMFSWAPESSAIAIKLAGYRAGDLTLLYDKGRIQRVAQAPSGAEQVRLIKSEIVEPATELTWFEVVFNYTRCANGNSSTLALEIELVGNHLGCAPVVTELRQSALHCPPPPSAKTAWHWPAWGGADTSQAAESDATLPFIVFYLLITLCIFCVGCIFIDPRTGE